MALGGMIGVSALTVGMSLAIRKWMKEGKRLRTGRQIPQLEMEEEASAPIEKPDRRKGPLEIEFYGSADLQGLTMGTWRSRGRST